MVNIQYNNKEDFWKYSYHVQRLIRIYENEFNEENETLLNKEKEIGVLIKKGNQNNIDLFILKSFCKEEWKTLVVKAIKKIRKTIKSRITKGIGFSDILIQINKIEEDLIDITNYELEWFENIYVSDIIRLRQDAKERIANERFYIIFTIVVSTFFLILAYYFQNQPKIT